MGAAEGAVEDFLEMMKTQVVRGQRLIDSESLQLRVAESSAEAEAARRMILGAAREIMEKLSTGAYTDEHDMALATRNAAYAVRLSQRSVARLFEASGGNGMFLNNHLQRTFRDVHAAGTHIGLAWDRNAAMYSRTRLGMGTKGFFPGR